MYAPLSRIPEMQICVVIMSSYYFYIVFPTDLVQYIIDLLYFGKNSCFAKHVLLPSFKCND